MANTNELLTALIQKCLHFTRLVSCTVTRIHRRALIDLFSAGACARFDFGAMRLARVQAI